MAARRSRRFYLGVWASSVSCGRRPSIFVALEGSASAHGGFEICPKLCQGACECGNSMVRRLLSLESVSLAGSFGPINSRMAVQGVESAHQLPESVNRLC